MIAADTFHDMIIIILQDISLVLGIAVAALVVFKMPIKRWQAWLHRHRDAREQLDKTLSEVIPHLLESHKTMDSSLEFIMSELKPNHGTSLKDAVNRIEKMIHHNEALQRGIISQDAKPMFITGKTGDLVWVNNAYLDLVNRDSTEVLGQGYWGIINPAELEDVRKQQTAARTDKRDLVTYFNVATGDPAQPLVPVEATAVPILDRDGNLDGYVGSMKRLDDHYSSYTDLKRIEDMLSRVEGQVNTNMDAISKLTAQEILRSEIIKRIEATLDRVESQGEKSEAMIRAWWAQEDIPMYMNDILGNCIWVNNAMIEICGYDSSQLLGKGWLIIVHTKDKARLTKEITDAIPENREVISYYTLVPGDDIEPFEVKAISIPLFDKSHNVIGYVGTLSRLDKTGRRYDDVSS